MKTQSAERSLKKEKTLFRLGYRMPAEWELHEATWLAWPHNEETWPEKVSPVEEIYLQMIEALAEGEKVHLLVNDRQTQDAVAKRLEARRVNTKNVIYFVIPSVDAWIRDYGPCFVLGGPRETKEIALVKWIFNAWGEKYESLMKDNETGDAVAHSLEMPRYFPEVVLEGGSIDTNGEGTCLMTEQCLLNPNRNPQLSKEAIENRLRDFLGFTHFIWLGEGIEGDDTDGHVDDITRFVNPTTVVTAVESNPRDRNEAPLRENLRRLEKATDEKGTKLSVVPIPMPGRVEAPWGRLPASYLNFYVANEVVLVPVFGHGNDEVALKTLREVFPKRRVVGIRSEVLVLGLGGIHCVTHEQPASR